MLNHFYQDQKQWNFSLQQMITQSRYSQIKSAQKQYPEYLILVRTHKSEYLFWKLQQHQFHDENQYNLQTAIL